MASSGKITLDANASSVGAELPLTVETLMTFYVFGASGNHENHEIGLEVRPAGSTEWVKLGRTVTGLGHKTERVVADAVRPCVVSPEGSVSEIDVYVIAR